ncbi:MAG TPA: peptidase domain-containing ABC transporter, partial [Ignavibacteria bacterium]|nr:peptidase domain-containing ABC transporter [Ignavibacteria bacterium]
MILFPNDKQYDAADCGAACLKNISRYYGKIYSLQTFRELSHVTREGVSLLGVDEAAAAAGFITKRVKINFEYLKSEVQLPCIVHWEQNHFVVVYKIKNGSVYISDPAIGRVKYSEKTFLEKWAYKNDEGIALLLTPSDEFFSKPDDRLTTKNYKFIFDYLKPHKKLFVQLMLGLFIGSIFQLIFPFLTQAIVDKGINLKNLNIIKVILVAQFFLVLGRTSVGLIRGWLMLYISSRVNISLIYDFLKKLSKLPMKFFDNRIIGDILQRIGDHQRIESFLTNSTLNLIFSILNFIVFSIVLVIYNSKIFLVFLASSLLYVLWVIIFLDRRKEIDYERFSRLSDNQSKVIQFIRGMQEIKLNNNQRFRISEWAKIQVALFRVNIKGLALTQYQQGGIFFINEIRYIIITFLSASFVINGDITIGMMLAIQYIVGQLDTPVDQLLSFIYSLQDAKISLERIHEVRDRDNESRGIYSSADLNAPAIKLDDVSFRYSGKYSEKVLKNISLRIPLNKKTAIVGKSGSGKTTLIKLLLGFYEPVEGNIFVGDLKLGEINPEYWRSRCGAVMQDGFRFTDTIRNNIALGSDGIDEEKLNHAISIIKLEEVIKDLPLKMNTKIGIEGHGLSQGQKQRILIARAVYKNPEILLFDEATNSLDAENEKQILNNIDEYFNGRTMIISAHRLSTVRNADLIVVLDKGEIAEQGTHS